MVRSIHGNKRAWLETTQAAASLPLYGGTDVLEERFLTNAYGMAWIVSIASVS